MNKTLVCTSMLLAGLLGATQALAWASANRFGGSTSHSWGSTDHTNRWGGSTDHAYGEGTEHTNAYGGSTAHAWGGGTEHTNVYGGSTYGAAGYGAAHTYPGGATAYRPPVPAYPAYPVYHPPVAVPVYSAGCYGCAAAAGAVVGVATGAAIASASTAAATSNAYAAGVAAGAAASAPPPPAAPASFAMGANYATLPAGCIMPTVAGGTYYLCGNTWFKPMYGANGVYYRVVPTP
jgi:hypothetical protein